VPLRLQQCFAIWTNGENRMRSLGHAIFLSPMPMLCNNAIPCMHIKDMEDVHSVEIGMHSY
jgi:hypothetical protein